MTEVRRKWGDIENVTEKTQKRRLEWLEWLGHLALLENDRIPKSILFGWLPHPCPRCGPRKRWRDVIRSELKEIEVRECEWYKMATTSRPAWRSAHKQGVEKLVQAQSQQAAAVERSHQVQ